MTLKFALPNEFLNLTAVVLFIRFLQIADADLILLELFRFGIEKSEALTWLEDHGSKHFVPDVVDHLNPIPV